MVHDVFHEVVHEVVHDVFHEVFLRFIKRSKRVDLGRWKKPGYMIYKENRKKIHFDFVKFFELEID